MTAPLKPGAAERLAAFFTEIAFSEVDMCDIQLAAHKHGLFVETVYDPDVHGPDPFGDSERGDPWYLIADDVIALTRRNYVPDPDSPLEQLIELANDGGSKY